jgi:hypothetical protein
MHPWRLKEMTPTAPHPPQTFRRRSFRRGLEFRARPTARNGHADPGALADDLRPHRHSEGTPSSLAAPVLT